MLQDAYKVQLDAFEGPLDLLLFLIRKSEVDIHDIPVATITEQYISYIKDVESVGRLDIDTAGEFLVMAATLMEIKSRMLMPKVDAAPASETDPAAPRAGKEDPRAELVRQLLEYKRYRDAANMLESRADEWRRRFPSHRAGVDDDRLAQAIEAAPDTELEDIDILDLVEAFRKISETVNFDRLGDHQVTYDDTPIELHAEDIVSRIKAELSTPSPGSISPGGIALQAMFAGRSRSEMVGLFLALLELVRSRRVRVAQDKVEGSIVVMLRDDPDPAAIDLSTQPPAAM